MKIQTKNGAIRSGGSGWGVKVDVNEELKFLWKFKKNIWGSGWVWVRVGLVEGEGVGW